jgi:hypothetical protein
LNGECQGSSLNPNEVEATLKVVKSVAADRQKQMLSQHTPLTANLYVPDDRCTMVPTKEVENMDKKTEAFNPSPHPSPAPHFPVMTVFHMFRIS